jgi:hypothetical protein
MTLLCIEDVIDKWTKRRIFTARKAYKANFNGQYIMTESDDDGCSGRLESATEVLSHFILIDKVKKIQYALHIHG